MPWLLNKKKTNKHMDRQKRSFLVLDDPSLGALVVQPYPNASSKIHENEDCRMASSRWIFEAFGCRVPQIRHLFFSHKWIARPPKPPNIMILQ